MSNELDSQEGSVLCRDFANGICKRRSCKFAHPKTAEDVEASEEVEDDSQICRDFLRNVCKRANCKFKHPKGTDKLKLARRKAYTFCHDYSNGNCRRRDCRFLHASKEEEEYFHDTGVLPPHLRAQAAVGFGNTDASITEGETPVCRDFISGKCDRGSRCKFMHVMPQRGGRERVDRSPYGLYMESSSFVSDDPYEVSYPPYKRRALDVPYYRRNDVLLEEENNRLRRKVEELKKQVGELTAANDVLLEQNARLRVSKVNSLTAVTMTTPSAVVSVTPAVTPIVTPAVAVPAPPQVNNAAAQLSALTASISQQVALNSEVVQQAMQAQLVQEALGAPHTSLAAGPASMSSLTPAMSMSQPALVSSPFART